MKNYQVKKLTTKKLCCWCDCKAVYSILDKKINWTDYACKNHYKKYFI